jgi:hypothetical protein
MNPADVGRFAPVVHTIKRRGAAAGWRRGRDICLRDWETLKEEGMNAYAVLKLAIEMDRHALFTEVAADKTRTRVDAQTYEEYQRYLAGEVDVAPAAGVAIRPTIEVSAGGDTVKAEALDEPKEAP